MTTALEQTPAPPRTRLVAISCRPISRLGIRTLLEPEPDLELVGDCGDCDGGVRLTDQLGPGVVIVSLPELTALDAVRRILALAPTPRVLVVSIQDDGCRADVVLGAGAAGYALGASACDDLLRAIRIVAGGGIYVDAAIAGQLVRRQHARGEPAISLSEREVEVIRLVAQGHTSKEMATDLGLSPRTLETYKARAMSKLNLHTRAELIRYALRSGWLRP
jgi:DNA-binding NarL/FixJ family response regulator